MPAVRRVSRTTDDAAEGRRSVRNPRRDRAEPEEEERPARGTRSRVRDDEDEAPARSTRLNRSGAKRSGGNDDDEAPAKGSVRRGWDGYRQTKEETGTFGVRLVIETEPHLIKFMEDEPYASYGQHWVDNPPAPHRKKSWICIKRDCPLCALGDRPKAITCFNVLIMDTGGEPEMRSLEVGPTLADQLFNFNKDNKTGPLTKLYWAVSKSGKQQTAATNFVPVKERDLEDDWPEIEPLTEEEFDQYLEECYTDETISKPSRKVLEEIAVALADD